MKGLFQLIFFGTTAVLGIVCPEQTNAQPDVYRIGVIAPLSGDNASVGKHIRQAIELAGEKLPDQDKFQFIFEDDQFEPVRSVTAYRALRNLKQINAVIVVGSGVGNAVAPLAEQDGVIMFAIGASDKTLASGRENVFIHWVSPEKEVQKMVAEIKKRNYLKIAMISHTQQGVQAFDDAFMEELKKEKLENRIVLKESFALDNKDFTTFIAKLRAKNTDSIYVALFPGALSTFTRKVRESAVKAEIFGAELFEDENEVRASKGALVGAWYINSDEASDNFVQDYRQKFNQHPGWATANAYDTVNLLAKAVAANGFASQNVSKWLKTVTNFPGAAGVYSATNDNRFDLGAAVKIVEKDGFKKIG